MEEPTGKLLESALTYLQKFSFSVIPIKPDKKPFIKWEPFQKRKATQEELGEWWLRWPRASIGLVTGSISDLCVIDVDEPNEGMKALSEYLTTSQIPTATTPRGGYHLYFKAPEKPISNNARVLPGCDFRGEGGYIIAPPSKNGTGKGYEWLSNLSLIEVERPPLPRGYIEFIRSSAMVRKFETGPTPGAKLFQEGNRDNSLFHVANCLVKGGMPENEIIQVLENLIISWGENPDPKWMNEKVQSALKRDANRDRNLTQEVRDLISVTSGHFRVRDIYNCMRNITPEDRVKIRVILSRLVEDEIVERVGKEDGIFRRIENQEETIDIRQKSSGEVRLWMPFKLEEKVKILPKNIITVGGTPDGGKTAFLLNVATMNRGSHNIFYFTSEMGLDELQERVDLMGISREEWHRKITTVERSSNFSDIIRPDALNIIDFLELSGDEYYRVGEHIRRIWEKLTAGVCFIAIQKRYGIDLPQGGIGAIEKARLALSFDRGTVKILKAKNWRDGKNNPNGLEMEFKLVDGWKFIESGPWTRASEPVKVPSLYNETEKQHKYAKKRMGKTALVKEFEGRLPA